MQPTLYEWQFLTRHVYRRREVKRFSHLPIREIASYLFEFTELSDRTTANWKWGVIRRHKYASKKRLRMRKKMERRRGRIAALYSHRPKTIRLWRATESRQDRRRLSVPGRYWAKFSSPPPPRFIAISDHDMSARRTRLIQTTEMNRDELTSRLESGWITSRDDATTKARLATNLTLMSSTAHSAVFFHCTLVLNLLDMISVFIRNSC